METIEQLASALGQPSFVVNCSGSVNYQIIANILKGFALSGTFCYRPTQFAEPLTL